MGGLEYVARTRRAWADVNTDAVDAGLAEPVAFFPAFNYE